MEYIELLKAERKEYKYKFISLLKDNCFLNNYELSNIYDRLLRSEKVKINLTKTDNIYLNNFVLNLMDIEISIGVSSFHEES